MIYINDFLLFIRIENQINIREIRQKITKFRLPNFVEEVEPTWRDCPLCGKPVVKSIGEYGEFCACATYPICKFACDEDELDELTNSPLPDCPICKDGKILPRKGRYGKFYGCSNYPQCNFTVPEDVPLPDTYGTGFESADSFSQAESELPF